jgi:hypothetical protein
MGWALAVVSGGVMGGLLYLVPGGVIFGFPASLPLFILAVVIGGVLGMMEQYVE